MDGDYNSDEEDQWNAQRKRRKFTKEDAMLGIFKGDSSEEEEEEKTTFKIGKKGLGISKPVGFVSGGVEGDENEKEEEEIAEKEEEEEERVGLGLGAKQQSASTNIPKSFQTNYGVLKNNSLKGTKPEFEKFTKGIGSKLLSKMGWQPGQGLGKENQGINAPIEVKLRQKNMGLGFAGDERTQQQKILHPGEEEMKEFHEQEMEIEPRGQGWKKSKPRKPKKEYKLPTQLPAQPAQKMVIEDMRGETPKIITNLKEISSDYLPVSAFMPEIQHNIRLITDLRESDILACERKQSNERDTIKKMSEEKERLHKIVKEQESRMQRITEIMDLISKSEQKIKENQLSLSSLAKVFLLLQKKYSEEFREHKLHLLASTLAQPLIKETLDSWQPLHHIAFSVGVEEFKSWKEIMQPNEPEDVELEGVRETKELDVYTQLIVDLLLPKLRNAITNEWKVREPDTLLRFLDAWSDLIPPIVMEYLVDCLIFPKLTLEVNNWNPRMDRVPIHQWVQPWLHYLGPKLETLYPVIRQKMVNVLQAWKPSDASAHVIIAPWKQIFDAPSMDKLLSQAIIPKLSEGLHKFQVNPRQQELDAFNHLLQWIDIIPIYDIVMILEEMFFPKWHQALYTWLSSRPNFEEVSRWYVGWKQLFPAEIVNHERIRAHLNHALSVMQSSVKGTPAPSPLPAYKPTAHVVQPVQPQAAHPKQKSLDELSMKEILERLGEERGLPLIPSTKRFEGKQTYTFGKHHILIDKEIVLRSFGGSWIPTSVEELLAVSEEVEEEPQKPSHSHQDMD